ncbi:RNA polymerase sigma-70 factor, ECF subfamily [Anaerovirgula multivorans]|uniref:RNA polymerase sigma factor n=1 Tax=Anaerovirgula multivorans TaxID=312168 RepID=A0A239HFH7_9FIRM|nr:sigma-70 family RNA polymerase sigma factor [Anaerovirgula multivorans]SNS80166.1 RNA polymerase sigma-70 factor, ECF subfamily [Anaerovirgula multivorans]
MSDTDLGRRFATGGEDELEEIINLYGEKLLRYATAILCDYQEAEDVVQDVFLSAYQNRAAFDGENLSAWLYKITYNRSLNQLKKRRVLYFSEIWDKAVSPAEDIGLSDETLRALRRLKPKERALLYGRIMEEQSYEDLSLLFGRSPVALRKQYERAKKRLAGYLTAGHYGKEQKHEYI